MQYICVIVSLDDVCCNFELESLCGWTNGDGDQRWELGLPADANLTGGDHSSDTGGKSYQIRCTNENKMELLALVL